MSRKRQKTGYGEATAILCYKHQGLKTAIIASTRGTYDNHEARRTCARTQWQREHETPNSTAFRRRRCRLLFLQRAEQAGSALVAIPLYSDRYVSMPRYKSVVYKPSRISSCSSAPTCRKSSPQQAPHFRETPASSRRGERACLPGFPARARLHAFPAASSPFVSSLHGAHKNTDEPLLSLEREAAVSSARLLSGAPYHVEERSKHDVMEPRREKSICATHI